MAGRDWLFYMKIMDLTHTISPGMPVYPGTAPPVFTVSSALEDAGFLERKITLCSHTGTHVDAPSHLLGEGITLDRLPADHFFGKAVSLNLTHLPSGFIDKNELKPHAEAIGSVEFVLLCTGWSRYWGNTTYFSNYPVLKPEAARWLSEFNLKGIGVDAVSADSADSVDFPIHKILLRRHIIIIENLTALDQLGGDPFFFSCFPMKFEAADGSPVRAVAMQP